MNHDAYEDAYFVSILQEVKTIALVGASPKPERPSFEVMEYLLAHGYRVLPVNPGQAGGKILGQRVFASLSDIGEAVDMVDIFRNSAAAGEVAKAALRLAPPPAVVWMQIGVRNDEAAAEAEAAGVRVVMDHCPKQEHARLLA